MSYIEKKIERGDCFLKRKSRLSPSTELVSIESASLLVLLVLVCIDLLYSERSKLGFESILVITDHQAFQTRYQPAKTTGKFLFENCIMDKNSLPADQGGNCGKSVIKGTFSSSGVEKSGTSPYHHMRKSMEERLKEKTNHNSLKSHKKDDWKSYVATFLHSYNATKHNNNGYT